MVGESVGGREDFHVEEETQQQGEERLGDELGRRPL